jgi:hypothetical protein
VSEHLFAWRTSTTARLTDDAEAMGNDLDPVLCTVGPATGGIPASEHLFEEFRRGIPVSEGEEFPCQEEFREEFRCQSIFSRGIPVSGNSGVGASFRVADDHDGAAHGRCRGDGK